MRPLMVAGDVRLFVLGDEGVLFSELRQELYTLNASATLLWCLLEEGVSLDGLVDAYAQTFTLTRAAAEHHVYPTLRRWFGLGHVLDPEVPGPGQTSLSEALACLLTNSELREMFRRSPAATGTAIGVVSHDRDAFVALDPDALAQQADDIALQRRRRRFGTPDRVVTLSSDEVLTAAASAPLYAETVLRYYRMVGTTFRLSLSPALDALVHPVLVHLETEAASAPDVVLHLRESNGGCVIFDGLMPVAWHSATAMMVPALKLLLRTFAVARHAYFMELHAGVVLLGNGALLLPGSAGRGKTTLTAALVRSGGIYFSDEIALLEGISLNVRPVPLAMTIKPGSITPLLGLYPELSTLDEHLREDRQPVRYLPPRPESRCPADQAPLPVRWVVFPHYEAGSETLVNPLSPAQGLRRLLDESLVLPDVLDRQNVERLVDWARRLQFYDLRMSSLEEGVRAVQELSS
ncbi:MAG: PqqD family peptide modification chaperone [Vicinamibacterales bacterium]